MTVEPNAFLERLRNLPDDQLALAFASDPEFLKKAQKALTEAKRQESESARARAEIAARGDGEAFDLKAWSKAKTLVTGPHNTANQQDLTAALAKTSVNVTPEGARSLLCQALDYLAEKQAVTFEWPCDLRAAGARVGAEEVVSLFKLLAKRPDFYKLGMRSRDFMHEVLNLPLPWADLEKRLAADKSLFDAKGIVDYLFDRSLNFSGYHNAQSDAPEAWNAMANLARLGCRPLTMGRPDNNMSSIMLRWQSLARLTPMDEQTAEAKVDAFEAMVALGWCDKGCAALTDNLLAPAGSERFALAPNSPGVAPLLDAGSRAALSTLCLHPSSVPIFDMICEREELSGFPRFDAVGRTRLYWANERARTQGAPSAVVGAWAQKCLELGDAPDSVNAQNPLAKCSTESLRRLLSAQIERAALSASSDPAAPSSRRKGPLSL